MNYRCNQTRESFVPF